MKLLTKEIEASLPKLYSQDGKPAEQVLVRVKFFTPDNNWTWYATEYDPEERRFFGLVDGQVAELGYFSLDELERARGPMGLEIERDKWFTPRPLAEIQAEIAAR